MTKLADWSNPDEDQAGRIARLEAIIADLQVKILKLQKDKSVYQTKSKLLSEELEKARNREGRSADVVDSLIERQRELNVMLNRSNMMLARAQEATSMLSLEFGELAKALPEPIAGQTAETPVEIEDRLKRINDLFKKTGSLSEEISQTLEESVSTQKKSNDEFRMNGAPVVDRQLEQEARIAEIELPQEVAGVVHGNPSESSRIVQQEAIDATYTEEEVAELDPQALATEMDEPAEYEELTVSLAEPEKETETTPKANSGHQPKGGSKLDDLFKRPAFSSTGQVHPRAAEAARSAEELAKKSPKPKDSTNPKKKWWKLGS